MNLDYSINTKNIKYKNITLFRSKEKRCYILLGSHPKDTIYGIIQINILKGNDPQAGNLKQIIQEETQKFRSLEEAKMYISKNYKDFQKQEEIKGIIGFVRFIQGYYLYYIKKINTVAKLGRHKIFSIEDTNIISLFEFSQSTLSAEEDYQKLMHSYNLKTYNYSSYTYDVTSSLSKNIIDHWREQNIPDQNQNKDIEYTFQKGENILEFENVFLWNKFVLQDFNSVIENKKWIMPIINGYCEQRKIKTDALFFSICLIGRRSNQYSGTRYLTRGINEEGFVANFVETEQIVIDLDVSTAIKPAYSSFLQIRGSIPLYWYQEPNLLVPKPPIKLNFSDPYLLATKKHIADLFALYGKDIFILNLVKLNEHIPREQILADEFNQAVNNVKEELEEGEIGYLQFDMKATLKYNKTDFVQRCYKIAEYCIGKTGIFIVTSNKYGNINLELQNGVVRSNCIDCLDRTNTFQQLIGEVGLRIQLNKLSNQQFNPTNELNVKVSQEYREMYEQLGDIVSKQYGSSQAHKQNIGDKNSSRKMEFITSLKRHFNNNLSDNKRQQQMDLFLGKFKPCPDGPHIQDTTPYVTLFPDLNFLKDYVTGKNWWSKAFSTYQKRLRISDIQEQCKKNEEGCLTPKGKQSKIGKKIQFTFDTIERMTCKGQKTKVKDNNSYKFVLSKEQNKSVSLYHRNMDKQHQELENKLLHNYNDIILIEKQEEERQKQQEKDNFVVQKNEIKQNDEFQIDQEELELFKNYHNKKSYKECMEEASKIKDLIDKRLLEQEEEDLVREINNYIENKKDSRYVDFKGERQQYGGYKKEENNGEKLNDMRSNQASILVQQPKKFTSEQKKLRILESIMKKSSSQRIKTNVI